MGLLNAIIVDDEYKGREVLKTLLLKYCPVVKIVGSASGVKEAKQLIDENNPDLVFLDIEMPGGGGFKLIEDFEEPGFNVIFVTSYDQYALKAIKFSALDYLLKPVLVPELQRAIEKAVLLKRQSVLLGTQLKILSSNLSNPSSPGKLYLNNKTRANYVMVKDIMYLRADVNYTTIYVSSGEKHLVAKPLKEYDEILCTPGTGFLRIHKSSIVNPSFVEGLEDSDILRVVLPKRILLEVSRRKRKEVEETLEKIKKIKK
jgi:two-component system LytT family response regulator